MAWSARDVKRELGSKGLLGMKEIIEHELVTPYPVLYEQKDEFVAHFKFTVLILPKNLDKINAAPLPYVNSVKKIEDPQINQILSMGTARKAKGKKNKKKKKKKK